MKYFLILFALITAFQSGIYAQNNPGTQNPIFDKKYYLQKSRQQKTFAIVSVATGGVLAVVGGYVWFLSPIAGISEASGAERAERTGKTMVVVGGSLMGISIPLFIASKRNKEKANLNISTGKVYLPTGIKEQLGFSIYLKLN